MKKEEKERNNELVSNLKVESVHETVDDEVGQVRLGEKEGGF